MSDERRETPESSGDAEIFVPPDAGDVELDGGSDAPREGWDDEPPDSEGSAWRVPIAVGLVLVLLLGGWLWWRGRGGPPELPRAAETPPAPPPPAEASVPMPETETDAPPLPDLRESDPYVREAVGAILEHPRLTAWMAPEGLVRRFVAAVDDVARGKSPRAHLVSLDPGRGFRVDRMPDGTELVSGQSFRRYDPFVDAFAALDTPEAMELYRRLEPLFEEAYRDLGYPDAEFRAVLETAIDRVLEVEVPDEPLAVEPRITSWAFADPELEALAPAEKHLLRLGPRNARKVQAKLRALKTALTLEPAGRS